MTGAPFYERKALAEMSTEEWESLCDGCGKCCLHKIEDVAGQVYYTNVACKLLNLGRCRCSSYEDRQSIVSDCIRLRPEDVATFSWLPHTCAYRLVADEKGLAWWHPLVSGDPETVHRAGVSVRGRAIPEHRAGDLEEHIVRWP